MLSEYKANKLIEIFVEVDDFCQEWTNYTADKPELRSVLRGRMSASEIMAILIFYQFSGYKCFEYYYEEMVQRELKTYFPNQVSYCRFLRLIGRCDYQLFLFLKWKCSLSQLTGIYFVDSKKLPVCHNRRIHQHRVFKHIAQRGKASTGWFYGFKIHLVINNLGEVVNFEFSSANVVDNNPALLKSLLSNLKGKCFGDKGYLTKIFEYFYQNGLKVVSKLRKNMKNKIMPLNERLWLAKRAVIESINDILMTVFDIDHTRHRNPLNALMHMTSSLIAYSYLEQKPTVILPNLLR